MFNTEFTRKRIGNLAFIHKVFLGAAVLVIFLWLVLTFFILGEPAVDLLSEYQVDKFAHFTGGILAAALLFLLFGIDKIKPSLYWTFVIGVFWEIFELVFFPDQMLRFRHEFLWWLSDTFFDLVIDVLGAYFWIEFFSLRSHNPPEN